MKYEVHGKYLLIATFACQADAFAWINSKALGPRRQYRVVEVAL